MSTILKLPVQDLSLRRARHENGLSLTQAASALSVSTSTLDSWECGAKTTICARAADAAYGKYRVDTENTQHRGKNVLFGCFPMRIARDLLECDVEEIAAEVGLSLPYWRKIEANARVAPPHVIETLEGRIRAKMASVCAL